MTPLALAYTGWAPLPAEVPMSELDTEIAAYEKMQRQLEAEHTGSWIIFRGADLVAVHDSFDAAAKDAVQRFGRGPYLIRQVGASPPIVSTLVG